MVSKVPILQMGEFLLVTLQEEIDDEQAKCLQKELAERTEYTKSRGIILDVSGLDIIDSFMGRTFRIIGATAKVLDAKAVIVGVQPQVAMTIVELGVTVPEMMTARNLQAGMQLLEREVN